MVPKARPWPKPSCDVEQGPKTQGFLSDVPIKCLEAGVADHTDGVVVTEASLALVTTGTNKARTTQTLTCSFVTTWALCPPEVTVTGSTCCPTISIRPIRTLADRCSTARWTIKSFPALALTCELVTLGAVGIVRVAVARLTAPATGHLPVIGSTLITLGTNHIGQTEATASLLITGHVSPRSQDATVTASTALWVGISESSETRLA